MLPRAQNNREFTSDSGLGVTLKKKFLKMSDYNNYSINNNYYYNNNNEKHVHVYNVRRGLIIYFMVYLIIYKKPSTLSFSTSVFNFSTYRLGPRDSAQQVFLAHILLSY